jgi:hypothetical protein
MPRTATVQFAAFLAMTCVFTVSAAAQPFVQSVLPSETFNTLTINGVNFGTAPPQVYLNFTPLAVQSSSPTRIVATLPPPLPPGSYSVVLVTGTQFAIAEVTLGGVGAFTLPSTGPANMASGFSSMALTMIGSSFNALSLLPERQIFRWRVDPVGNGGTNPSGRLNLLFGVNSTPTGLGIGQDGRLSFAAGQAFPGVVSRVAAGAGLVSSGTQDDVALSVPPAGVNGTMILNGTVGAADIAAAAITAGKLAFDPATQAELAAHVHDDRHYRSVEVDALFHPIYTKLVNTDDKLDSILSPTFELMRELGSFTKIRPSSRILVMWNASAVGRADEFDATANKFCGFQVRIDGMPATFGAGQAEVRVITQTTPLSVAATFDGLPAGQHVVEIWSRSNMPSFFPFISSCTINPARIPETIIIRESGG